MADAYETEAYRAAVVGVVMAARALEGHDLEGILAAISRADTLAPMIDPTLWREKHKAMAEDAEMLRAALPLWKLGRLLASMQKKPYSKPEIRELAPDDPRVVALLDELELRK